MSIYAKRLNSAQRRLLRRYESLTGFEPLCQDDLDAGDITFAELWRKNVKWIEDLSADVQNLHEPRSGQWAPS